MVPALSDVELVDFAGIGTLEAFYTDGLRTLLRTLPVPELTEKTLRYPGHAALARALRESGFLENEPVRTRAGEAVPRALTEALLVKAWELPEGEEEFTVLRVIVEGSREGRSVCETWDLLDRTDRATRSTSMARTSGFPAAVVARLLAGGRVREPGLQPPELLARDPALSQTILDELARRGIAINRRTEPMAGRLP